MRAGKVIHGGSVAAGRRLFPNAPEPWIDLSTGINPFPYSAMDLPPHAFSRLPEPDDLAALEAAASDAYGASPLAAAVAAPGTQCLISLLPHLFRYRRVRIIGPTYAEHARAWTAAGSAVSCSPGLPETELDPAGADVVVLCNPNNPDGRTAAPARLLGLAARMAAAGGLLLVDEAFADLEDGISLAPYLPRPGLIVLRSFGKTYGLAGLRLGFALAPQAEAAAIREALGPWPVSGPAIAIGRKALADAPWRRQARARLDAACRRLDRLVPAAGLKTIGGTRLFRLMEGDAQGCFARLGGAGILIRRFPEHPGWLRFGLPGHEQHWQRLEAALR